MSRVPLEQRSQYTFQYTLMQAAMPPFVVFALLYMTAVFLELSERWSHPLFTAAMLELITVLVLTRITRVTFLIFLALTTAHFL